jgi:hypothetical protein
MACAGKTVSCWHEIPLYAGDGNLHYICEIPKETSAKMEVATVSPRENKPYDSKSSDVMVLVLLGGGGAVNDGC